jgi:hypothetical protein
MILNESPIRAKQKPKNGVASAVVGQAQLGSGGVVQDETRSASDATAQVVDTGTRVNAQQASIARITDLMKNAANLSEVVSLEGELSRRAADLESMQAQLAALNDQVSVHDHGHLPRPAGTGARAPGSQAAERAAARPARRPAGVHRHDQGAAVEGSPP